MPNARATARVKRLLTASHPPSETILKVQPHLIHQR
jgi:hypothetical protein